MPPVFLRGTESTFHCLAKAKFDLTLCGTCRKSCIRPKADVFANSLSEEEALML